MTSFLPEITERVAIDGSEIVDGSCRPTVTIDGSLAGPGIPGLNLNTAFASFGPNVTIRGLAFVNFSSHGLSSQSGDFHTIDCSNFGVDTLGNPGGNGQAGISFSPGGSQSRVTDSEIAFNTTHGISVSTFGTLRSGDIGGLAVGEGNEIHDNGQYGVAVGDNADFEVRGNWMYANGLGGLNVISPSSPTTSLDSVDSDTADGLVTGLDPFEPFDIDLYVDGSCDDAQGETYWASDSFSADDSGFGAWSFVELGLAPFDAVTAYVSTAGESFDGSTSNVSGCLEVEDPGLEQPGPDYVVNSLADTDTDGICEFVGGVDGCSLREALLAANADGVASTITFDGLESGDVIDVQFQLPTITEELVLDATGLDETCAPAINIDGSLAGIGVSPAPDQLVLRAGADRRAGRRRVQRRRRADPERWHRPRGRVLVVRGRHPRHRRRQRPQRDQDQQRHELHDPGQRDRQQTATTASGYPATR